MGEGDGCRGGFDGVDWRRAATEVAERGWFRARGVLDGATCAGLIAAAPESWEPLPEVEGVVRQRGFRCGVFFDRAAMTVRAFGLTLCDALNGSGAEMPEVPLFNEVQWGRSHDGVGYITAHRDPPAAGGVIAVVNLQGHAVFRVGLGSDGVEWETEVGDVVVLRGHGWPAAGALCPVHEAEARGDRVTMTLRHNTGGPGADYFGS